MKNEQHERIGKALESAKVALRTLDAACADVQGAHQERRLRIARTDLGAVVSMLFSAERAEADRAAWRIREP